VQKKIKHSFFWCKPRNFSEQMYKIFRKLEKNTPIINKIVRIRYQSQEAFHVHFEGFQTASENLFHVFIHAFFYVFFVSFYVFRIKKAMI